jgi:hypothetical protein
MKLTILLNFTFVLSLASYGQFQNTSSHFLVTDKIESALHSNNPNALLKLDSVVYVNLDTNNNLNRFAKFEYQFYNTGVKKFIGRSHHWLHDSSSTYYNTFDKVDSSYSIRWNGQSFYGNKDYYVYDTLNRKTQFSYKTKYNTTEWVNFKKDTTIYDNNGNVHITINYYWNDSIWVPSDKSVMDYNAKGLLIKNEQIFWDSTHWKPNSFYTISYDSLDNPIHMAYFEYVSISVRVYKEITFTYNSNGLLVEKLVSQGASSGTKTTYAYDANGNTIQYNLFIKSSGWRNNSKSESTYSSTNKLLTYKSYYWRNQSWYITDKDSLIYNNLDSLVKSTSLNYEINPTDTTGGITENIYDTLGNIIQIKNWKYQFGNWVYQGYYTNVFDNNYSSQDIWTTEKPQYSKKIDSSNVYSHNSSGNLTYVSSTLFYYSPINILETVEISSSNFSVFPNPINDILNVKSNLKGPTHIVIYDLTGKQLLARSINQTEYQIDMSNYIAGVYFIQFINEYFTQTHKIIKN